VRNWIFWGFFAVAHRHGSHEGHERWPILVTLAMYPVLVATYALLARREEAEMFAQFGDEYRRYRAAVPAFVPRIGGPAGPRHA
jgi:protein-S-isoprenylcysteine O-methyltransferase Ste14